MTLPIEFENELENWLRERFARQRREVLEGVVEMVAAMLTEQIKSDRELWKREFAQLQESVDQMRTLVENMARLDRATSGEHSTMN